MSEVKKTMAQGFADGKDWNDYLKRNAVKYVGAFFTASSSGNIVLSSGHTVRPAVGDIVMFTTGDRDDDKAFAGVVTAASSANFRLAPTALLSSDTFLSSAGARHGGYLVQFSVWPTT